MKITWHAAYFGGPNSPWYDLILDEWQKRVNARLAPSSLEIQHHYGGVLGKGPESIDGIKAGTFEITQWYPSHVPTKTPLSELVQVAGWDVDAEKTAAAIYDYLHSPLILDEFAKWDAIPWLPGVMDPRGIICKPVTKTLDDIEGQKVRSSGKLYDLVMLELGSTTVTLSTPECYGAIQTGVLDSVVTGHPSAFTKYAFHEVAKYILDFGFGREAGVITMKKSTFEGLPQKWQDIMLEEAVNMPKAIKDINTNFNADAFSAFEKEGVTITLVSAAEKARIDAIVDGVLSEWEAEKGQVGIELVKLRAELIKKYQ
ncbi:TRAP transporter substrate-binding protein DctP [Chloroflexota bacterium]